MGSVGSVWVKCGRFKKVQKVPKFRDIFIKCGMCGIDFQERKKINGVSNRFSRDVTGNHFPRFRPNRHDRLQQSRNLSHGGAVQTIQQACERKKPNSAAFWNAYQMSLCNHLHQLEQDTQPDDKQQEKKLLRDGIRTVQAILYAIA